MNKLVVSRAEFATLETTDSVDRKFDQVVKILREEGTKLCKTRPTGKKSKLTRETLELMSERRQNPPSTLSENRALNKKVTKLVRRDLRASNTLEIEKAIEQNRGSKVFVQPLKKPLDKVDYTSR